MHASRCMVHSCAARCGQCRRSSAAACVQCGAAAAGAGVAYVSPAGAGTAPVSAPATVASALPVVSPGGSVRMHASRARGNRCQPRGEAAAHRRRRYRWRCLRSVRGGWAHPAVVLLGLGVTRVFAAGQHRADAGGVPADAGVHPGADPPRLAPGAHPRPSEAGALPRARLPALV